MIRRARMQSPARGGGTVLIVGFILCACDVPDTTDGRAAGAVPTWRLSPEPVLTLGGVEPPEPEVFVYHRGVKRIQDSRIAVGEAATNEIRFFDEAGNHLGSVGHTGEGPGEFREIWSFFEGPGDTLWVFPNGGRKITGFHDGEYMRDLPFREAEAGWPLGWAGSSLIARAREPVDLSAPRPEYSPGPVERQPGYIVALDADGNTRDTVVTILGQDGFLSEDLSWQIPLLGRRSWVAIGPDRVYVGDSGSTELLMIGVTGDTVGALPVPAITGRAREELIAARRVDRLEGLEPAARAQQKAMDDAMPLPQPFTDISDLRVDVAGNIWVRRVPLPADSTTEWHIYDPAGTPLGRIDVPVGLRIGQIGADEMLGVERGEFDVWLVVRYRIIRDEAHAPAR